MQSVGRITIGEVSVTDTEMRLAAFKRVQELSEMHGFLTRELLNSGFQFQGQKVALHNPGQGIHKPNQMQFLLSIKTVYPGKNKKVWYDDQLQVHQQIFEERDSIDYAFMGNNPNAAQNQHLFRAFDKQIPIIYFLGIAPGRYEAIFPTFVRSWNPATLNAELTFGESDRIGSEHGINIHVPQDEDDRRYAHRQVKQRLHQSTFRQQVILAYKGRCAVSGLREPRLIDAAHIVPDPNPEYGQPIVPNGLTLSKIHHAAFDANLIGIDPDYRLHLSGQLLSQKDGPLLEALKKFHKQEILLPHSRADYPDRDRLEIRFEQFKKAA